MPETLPPRRRRWLRWLAAVSLAIVALVAAANVYLILAARAATVSSVDAAPARPYAIVLGNRVLEGGVPSLDLAARLETALALYKAGRADRLVVSGLTAGDYDEPHAMAAWLEARGVSPADIVVDPGGYRTAATMAGSVALGVRSALVVSQGYHLPRALYFARRAGIDAVGVPAPWLAGARWYWFKVFIREATARAEALLEVALRGVR
jgi:vancomycin permeability regulator SanA